MRQSPHHYAHPRSRWTLALLQRSVPALEKLRTLSGVWRRLRKWRLAWKRGRLSVTSPDPAYASKLALIGRALEGAQAKPEAVSVLYADETTCHRQPFVTCFYTDLSDAIHE